MPKLKTQKDQVGKFIRLDKSLNERIKKEANDNGMNATEMIQYILEDYFKVKDAENGDGTLKEIIYRLNDQNSAINDNLSEILKATLQTQFSLQDFLKSFQEPDLDNDDLPMDYS